jgi:hypothetical protein
MSTKPFFLQLRDLVPLWQDRRNHGLTHHYPLPPRIALPSHASDVYTCRPTQEVSCILKHSKQSQP